MSVYRIVSAGDQSTVTKDGTPLGTTYATPLAALKAAHTDAVDGDTYELQNAVVDGELSPFDLGQIRPWLPNTEYAVGDLVFCNPEYPKFATGVVVSGGTVSLPHVYKCTAVAGTKLSAASGDGPMGTTPDVDNDVTWTFNGTGNNQRWRITKGCIIQGIPSDSGDMAKMTHGGWTIHIFAPGKDIEIRGIHIDEWAGRGIFNQASKSLKLIGNRVTNSTLRGKLYFESIIGTGIQGEGDLGRFRRDIALLLNNVTSEIYLKNNYVNFEEAPDSAPDPLADLTLGDTRKWCDWFGCTVVSVRCKSTCKLKYEDNQFYNYTNNGANLNTFEGDAEIVHNHIEGPWFYPQNYVVTPLSVGTWELTAADTVTVTGADANDYVKVGDHLRVDSGVGASETTTPQDHASLLKLGELLVTAISEDGLSVTVENGNEIATTTALTHRVKHYNFGGWGYQIAGIGFISQWFTTVPWLQGVGTLVAHDNTVVCRGPNQVGYRFIQKLTPRAKDSPGPISLYNNTFLMRKDARADDHPSAVGYIDLIDRSYVGQNVVEGKAVMGFTVGNRLETAHHSEKNVWMGNDTGRFEVTNEDGMFGHFGLDAYSNALVGGSNHSAFDEVEEGGDVASKDNRITGVVRIGLGQDFLDVLQEAKPSDLTIDGPDYGVEEE